MYSTRIVPPGIARITGGTSCPSKANAPFPVIGSLIARSSNGDNTWGGLGSGVPMGGVLLWAFSFAIQMTVRPTTNAMLCMVLRMYLGIIVLSPKTVCAVPLIINSGTQHDKLQTKGEVAIKCLVGHFYDGSRLNHHSCICVTAKEIDAC
jgi:hypothetical protein